MPPITQIFKTVHGSRLYGTAVPSSDYDFKGVHLPSGRGLLLCRPEDHFAKNTGDAHKPNAPGDIDFESFSLNKFLSLVNTGDMSATEMLFAPTPELSTDEWAHIIGNRDRLIHKNVRGFVGYCRRQASLYGASGDRINEAKAVQTFLSSLENAKKLGHYETRIAEFLKSNPFEHIKLEPVLQKDRTSINHLSVCDRKLPFTISILNCKIIVESIVADYGNRARAAAQNDGVDWKSMMHAVRVANQAIELLTHSHITFPRPEAAELIAIRNGNRNIVDIGQTLDASLLDIENLIKASPLPTGIDQAFFEDVLVEFHSAQIDRDMKPEPDQQFSPA